MDDIKTTMERQFLATSMSQDYGEAYRVVARLQHYRSEYHRLNEEAVESRKEIGRLRGLVSFLLAVLAATWLFILAGYLMGSIQ